MNRNKSINSDINQNSDIYKNKSNQSRFDIRRKFDDNIEIAKEFQSPTDMGEFMQHDLIEEGEKKLLKEYKKKKQK